jgi:hypothetical protein
MRLASVTGLLRLTSGCMVGQAAMADFNKVVARGVVCYAIAAFLFFTLVSYASQR